MELLAFRKIYKVEKQQQQKKIVCKTTNEKVMSHTELNFTPKMEMLKVLRNDVTMMIRAWIMNCVGICAPCVSLYIYYMYIYIYCCLNSVEYRVMGVKISTFLKIYGNSCIFRSFKSFASKNCHNVFILQQVCTHRNKLLQRE